jgi:hypothetical protein
MKEHGSRISFTNPQLDLEPGPITMHERTWVIFLSPGNLFTPYPGKTLLDRCRVFVNGKLS